MRAPEPHERLRPIAPVPTGQAGAYAGQRIALLTQHGKERVIAPVLEAATGCLVQRVDGFDTDQLGTFTREIPRAGTQREAARQKARLALALSGLGCGLGSEGAFGPDPTTGLLPWNVELLVFIDEGAGIEVVGSAQGRANHAHRLTNAWSDAQAFARQVGFPAQQLVLRPDGIDHPVLCKGIADWDVLKTAFEQTQAQANTGQVWLETDLRAHANPMRMAMIERAAQDLALKLQSHCPACGSVGFWMVDRVAGLPCAECGAPTRVTQAWIHGCLKCGHRSTRPRDDLTLADPRHCDHCNP